MISTNQSKVSTDLDQSEWTTLMITIRDQLSIFFQRVPGIVSGAVGAPGDEKENVWLGVVLVTRLRLRIIPALSLPLAQERQEMFLVRIFYN